MKKRGEKAVNQSVDCRQTDINIWAVVLPGALLLGGAGYISTKNYLIFHTFTEMFTIIISFTIALIVLNSYRNLKNDFIPIIGISYAFAGLFDLLHTLAYEGMGIFTKAGTNLAPQMWIIARYLDGFGMMAAGISLYRTVKPRYILIGYTVISLLALLSVFQWNIFPICFVDGQGLTPFKIYSEYIISLLLVASVLLLMHHKGQFHPRVYRLLLGFFIISVFTELAFTFYNYMYGWQNMIGHLFKVTAFFFLYRAIVETSIREPFNLLFFQLNQAYSQLEYYAAELAEKNLEITNFTNIVSHDLRAPLINIKGFSQELDHSMDLLKKNLQNPIIHLEDGTRSEVNMLLEKDVPEALKFIGSSVNRMERMIGELLKLSRIGRREWHNEKVDMNELVKGVSQSLKHQIEQKNIHVELGSLPQLTSDCLAMEQIIGNLLDNSIKYMESGRTGKISIYCTEAEDKFVFSIQDNGRGIAAEEQEKIFEIFQRAGKRDVAGEGMGLAYVRTLVRNMGGRVWCESELGLGTTMYFTVPNRPLV